MGISETLVLGATGRLGEVLRKRWPDGSARWQARRPQPGPGWYVLDPLSEPGALTRAASGCGTILCLAGAVPGRSDEMEDNRRLAIAAVRAGASAGVRVLLASSAAVYGARPGILTEETPPAPVAEYGRSKAVMEEQAVALAEALGVSVTCLRIGNVAGSDAILGGWQPGFKLDRFPDGSTPRRSYIGPVTLARVLWDLVHTPELPKVMNLAAPGAVEMGALLDAAGLEWTPRPAPESAIAEVRLSTTRLEDVNPFGETDSHPETIVREWQDVRA
ncbi:NAD(P)-dependent oxidoreductase [Ruegeria sp. HKCCD8929]|uniref:NAD-dependent epimerase/dehydratase family protein n=1 Tax=Ruegeria sp. HKCCD8929 TaxID=2683006 RepID=UPI00148836FC|nr:NAD-dependent epimerase/dehydratase family protein [Ruegeria sp. HKCCD8929]